MQNEITSRDTLLDKDGYLKNPGYAKNLLLDYNRDSITANAFRIKEWDYYIIYNDHYGVALTLADNSYMGLISASMLDFDQPSQTTTSIMTFMPMGKTKLPSSSASGNVSFTNSRVSIEFLNDGKVRKLYCHMANFKDKLPLAVEIELNDFPKESMVIATPFKEDKRYFYYNQKINCMRAKGYAKLGETEYIFEPQNSFGTLDWGRGVWTYKNTWYWGSASGLIGNNTFGFNIGYGFGDTSMATENMLFFNGTAHKLQDITFNIPTSGDKIDYLKPWTFTSSDHRFEMDFKPIIDRSAYSSALIISSDQHQVFGKFTGKAILDDGTVIELKDFLGFAERVVNRW